MHKTENPRVLRKTTIEGERERRCCGRHTVTTLAYEWDTGATVEKPDACPTCGKEWDE